MVGQQKAIDAHAFKNSQLIWQPSDKVPAISGQDTSEHRQISSLELAKTTGSSHRHQPSPE
jgi:hypothetical protein